MEQVKIGEVVRIRGTDILGVVKLVDDLKIKLELDYIELGKDNDRTVEQEEIEPVALTDEIIDLLIGDKYISIFFEIMKVQSGEFFVRDIPWTKKLQRVRTIGELQEYCKTCDNSKFHNISEYVGKLFVDLNEGVIKNGQSYLGYPPLL